MGIRPAALYKALRKDLEESFPNSRYNLDEPIAFATSVPEAAARSLLISICKKWVPEESSRELRDIAIAGFLDCNSRCASWSPTTHPLYGLVLDEMALRAASELPDLHWNLIFSHARMGPGASVLSGGKNSYLEKLFLNRLSTTSEGLYKAYRRYVALYPLYKAGELRRLSMLGERANRIVEGSTLSTVRKNVGTDRTICTEPSLNMFAQLGIGEILNKVLLDEYGYDPAIQQVRNRKLARRGSRTGSIATIDLKSASDLIALGLTQYTLPGHWSAAISDTRSHSTKVDGQYVVLNMVSSMGNGFTFPLQTYLFSLAIRCLCKVLDVQWSRYDSKNTMYGVFGDDIVVPASLAVTVMGLLRSLGFIPNEDKSFHEGDFRESCGGDYFRGQDIRGVYIRAASVDSECFSAVNRLNMWSARWCVPLRRTIRLLLPKGWTQLIIPSDEDDSAGIKTPWPTRKCESGNYLYTALRPRIQRRRVYVIRKKRVIGFYRQFDNPFGILLMTINGSIRSGCISRRQRDIHFDQVERRVPFWVRHSDLAANGVAYSDWEVLTRINLNRH